MKVKVKVEGLRDLDRALAQLGKPSLAKASARRALKKAAEPMVSAAQANAPTLSGALKLSIHAGTKVKGGNAGKQAFAAAMRAGASRAQAGVALRAANSANAGTVLLFVGPGSHPQGIFQEFGVEHHPPQPFMRPAWDGNKRAMLDRIKAELAADIFKTAARARARAAKLAAKGG
jgi:HK97 gp10 family phage protein